jgi:hypothetical protein
MAESHVYRTLFFICSDKSREGLTSFGEPSFGQQQLHPLLNGTPLPSSPGLINESLNQAIEAQLKTAGLESLE